MNRESIFSMRLNTAERELLDEMARAANRKPGELMRELLRNYAMQVAARKRGDAERGLTVKH